MKCAYCKEMIRNGEEQEYTVEINGVECKIWMHYNCLMKVIGEYFTRPKETASDHHYVTTITPLNEQKLWEPKWTTGSTTGAPPEPDHKVWCKADDGSTHTPWKDRVD